MFWKKRLPPFDAERHIGQILLNLPRCPQRVVAIDHILDRTFDCAYVLLAEDLLRWMEDFSSKVLVCGAEPEATQTAFIMWLRSADRSDSESVMRVPPPFFEFYSSHVSELVKETDGYVYCAQCEVGYDEVPIAYEETQQGGGGWRSGVEVWRCPKHHRLRSSPYRFHLLVCDD
jgi:hypothetical protein